MREYSHSWYQYDFWEGDFDPLLIVTMRFKISTHHLSIDGIARRSSRVIGAKYCREWKRGIQS